MAGLENVLLVALTGFGQESDRQRARKAGFDEFLVKPALPDVVADLAGQVRSGDISPGVAASDS